MPNLSRVKTIAFSGINVLDIDVEVHFAKGQPGITIVGLGDKAVSESRDRIRAALSTLGLILPPYRITINLAPADILKEGSHYDLPIALAILQTMNVIPNGTLDGYVILGELGLDGTIRQVNGVLPTSFYAYKNKMGVICPYANGTEAAWSGKDVPIIAAENLAQLIRVLKGQEQIDRPQITKEDIVTGCKQDMSDVKGQHEAKFAMEIAAAGGHNILLIGSPGTGKSMLASRIATILPPLSMREMLDVSMIQSVAGMLKNGVLSSVRPFRAPHHTASRFAMIGGGSHSRPGEITLAHNGVLFLDELPEYQRDTIEALRQPMETGDIAITRVNAKVVYPANFQLVAAMNPCKCGFYGSQIHACKCSRNSIINYQSKISGPLLDRIDIHVRMEDTNHKFSDLTNNMTSEESSASIRRRVIAARNIQAERYKDEEFSTNACIPDGKAMQKYCSPADDSAYEIIDRISEQLQVSMRGIGKILRVARTIADLENSEDMTKEHILRAALFRQKMMEE